MEKQDKPQPLRPYADVLDEFNGASRSSAECVAELMKFGYSRGQARNATYRYRLTRGLTRARKDV